MNTCIHCGIDFSPREKMHQARVEGRPVGYANECIDCVDSDEVRVTGAMIYTGEGTGELQVNADPRLTKLLNRRRSQTTTHGVNNSNKPIRLYNKKER